MTSIIAIINQKGGCGKTTTCINLSAELAKRKKNTLVIDLDHQADTTKILMGNGSELGLTSSDLFDKNSIDINKTIRSAMDGDNEIDNLFFIPSHIKLSRIVETTLTRHHREKILKRHLEKINKKFDFIILDCPPNLSVCVINALFIADLFLIPIDGGRFALDGLSDLLDVIEDVRESKDINYFVFRNEFAKQNKLMNDFLEEQLNSIKKHVLKSKISRSESIGQSSAVGKPLLYFAPQSKAVDDYKTLVNELLNNT